MSATNKLSALPPSPAIYVLYGGKKPYPAYVGISKDLRSRIRQHLERRDSSIVTGASIVSLNPDKVTEIRWWLRPEFDAPHYLKAAELVAFDVFEPVLRSRGKPNREALELFSSPAFVAEQQAFFEQPPAGRWKPLSLLGVNKRLAELEEEVASLRRAFGNTEVAR